MERSFAGGPEKRFCWPSFGGDMEATGDRVAARVASLGYAGDELIVR